MSKNRIDFLNEDVFAGYHAGARADNPHLFSSPSWEAFELGRWLHNTGRPNSRFSPSRGSTWRNGREFKIRFDYPGDGAFVIGRVA